MRKGLSQEALAHDAGIARGYMSRVETADTWVGTEIIAKLAAVLEIEPHELLVPPPRRGKARLAQRVGVGLDVLDSRAQRYCPAASSTTRRQTRDKKR
jgi:transcriptional regulator with XRE-family HTH domain